MIVRPQQLAALRESSRQSWIDSLRMHLSEFSPALTAAAGESNLRRLIASGITQAEKYGFTQPAPVQLFLEMMLSFGASFDTDPQYAWAACILHLQTDYEQQELADILFREMELYLDRIYGPEDHHIQAAFLRFQQLDLGQIASAASVERSCAALEALYPEKGEFIGSAILEELHGEGSQLALQHGLDATCGPTVIAIAFFALGHGVFTDPMYTSLGGLLIDREGPPMERARLILQGFRKYAHVLSNTQEAA